MVYKTSAYKFHKQNSKAAILFTKQIFDLATEICGLWLIFGLNNF